MPDKYEIKSDTRRQKADGTWEQTIQICVKDGGAATADKTVWVTSFPWDDKHNKIGKRRFDSLDFKKGDKCKSVTFEFSTEPKQAYTDLYGGRNADGTFTDWIEWNVKVFAMIPVPGDQVGHSVVATVLPLAYPYGLEQQNLGAMSFQVRSILGAAPWVVDSIYPAEGDVFTLQPAEKSVPLIVRVSNPVAVAEGYRKDIVIEVEPLDYDDPIAVATYTLRIVKDTTAPEAIAVPPVINHATGIATFSWTISDTVSGLRTPSLRFSLDGGATWTSRFMDVAGAVYNGDVLTSGTFSTAVAFCTATSIEYELVASDEVYNTYSSGVLTLAV